MGMMAASLFLLLSREAWHISNLAQEPIYLVSRFLFPGSQSELLGRSAASIIPSPWGWTQCASSFFPVVQRLGFLP
jgi:ABC-2 type transport system permease protein